MSLRSTPLFSRIPMPVLPFPALLLVLLFLAGNAPAEEEETWRAGAASVVITPQEPVWMAGFAVRDRPADGRLHDLYVSALALEDARGNRSVLIGSDLLGFPAALSNRIRDRIGSDYGLSRSDILLNSSHSHSGPVLSDALLDIYPIGTEELEQIDRYTARLEQQIVELAGRALERLEPARLHAGNGVARFQVNRRNNDASTLHLQTELAGPVDPAVPVIRVENLSGDLIAIAFGYACHPTTLSGYDWSGDYPGFARIELERRYPGTTALFFQGAGADQNPLPRGSVSQARQYGKTLAAAVEQVLDSEMRELSPRLGTAYAEIDLPMREPLEREELVRIAQGPTDYINRWARRMIREIDRGETFAASYPFPLQAWSLGDQALFALGGELVVGYSIRLKEIFGSDAFVLGYSNDVMAYIPTTRILLEGGYEGHTSHKVYGLPAPWTAEVESLILTEMVDVARRAGIRADRTARSD